MKRLAAMTLALGMTTAGMAAEKPADLDLTGNVAFDVSSTSGRVERIAVTVGDGGSGRYKAILAGDPGLPTHTIFRPKDLSAFSASHPLPIVAFANGGCRNTSGEFRNFLSEIASHGYLVVAIGPAGTTLVGGSEGRLGVTKPSQLVDGINWVLQENERKDSAYYQKLDAKKIAFSGQSCGGVQALDASADPRVTTTIVLNSSASIGARPNAAPATNGAPAPTASASAAPAPPATNASGSIPGPGQTGQYGAAGTNIQNMFQQLEQMARRYEPYGPPSTPMGSGSLPADDSTRLTKLHSPVLYLIGGPSDLAYPGASRDFASIEKLPVAFVNQDVGHYPGTYRQPHGGSFAVTAIAWLDWQLKGEASAKKMFVGADCGLCKDPSWKVATKNLN
jgi:hypothetical protein